MIKIKTYKISFQIQKSEIRLQKYIQIVSIPIFTTIYQKIWLVFK